jgi:hypothetical protein
VRHSSRTVLAQFFARPQRTVLSELAELTKATKVAIAALMFKRSICSSPDWGSRNRSRAPPSTRRRRRRRPLRSTRRRANDRAHVTEYRDVLLPDLYGNTCLHYFALRNNGHALEELASYGVCIHSRNNANQTPLDVRDTGMLEFIDSNTDVVSLQFFPDASGIPRVEWLQRLKRVLRLQVTASVTASDCE